MNQHYRFWVQYYDELLKGGITVDTISRHNRQLTESLWIPGEREILPAGKETFCLRVGYPGLLVGLGSSHESGRAKKDAKGNTPEEIKLGITLDPVTGLPFLPGSTVKGILRSAFLANTDYVAAVLSDIVPGLSTRAQLERLELASFGKQHPAHDYEVKQESGIGADVFLDAYPVLPDREGHLLGIENITPHRPTKKQREDGLEGLTEPNPLTLLKVMPGVVFRFRFMLQNSEIDGITVTAADKRELFRRLLLDLGAGAKTNVGFGALSEAREVEEPRYLVQTSKTGFDQWKQAFGAAPKQVKKAAALTSASEIEKDVTAMGTVKRTKSGKIFVVLVPAPEQGKTGSIDGVLDPIPDGKALENGAQVAVTIVKIEANPSKASGMNITVQLA